MGTAAWAGSMLEANPAHIYLSLYLPYSCPPPRGHLSREGCGGLQGKALCAHPRHLVASDVASPGEDLPYAGYLLVVHVSLCFQGMSAPVPGSHQLQHGHPRYSEDKLYLSASKASNNQPLSQEQKSLNLTVLG